MFSPKQLSSKGCPQKICADEVSPLGPLGSSSSQHRRTLELILQEGSAIFSSIKSKVRKDRPLQKELSSNRLKRRGRRTGLGGIGSSRPRCLDRDRSRPSCLHSHLTGGRGSLHTQRERPLHVLQYHGRLVYTPTESVAERDRGG